MTGPDQQPESAGALDGLRVVDLTHHLGGPLATMALAQLGADVVKVEPPEGDGWRHVDDVQGESRVFHAVNRGKRGVVLDLRAPEGRAALHRLVADADVVVHSFAPGVAERIGAGADELMALNPRLVYCSLSAFGPQGRRGTDVALQSRVGPGHGQRRPRDAGPRARHRRAVDHGGGDPGRPARARAQRARPARGDVTAGGIGGARGAPPDPRGVAASRSSTASSGRSTGRTPPATARSRWPATPPACTRAPCGPSGWASCSTTRVSRTPRRAPATRTSWPS